MVAKRSKKGGNAKKNKGPILIFGKTGWIGGMLGELCEKQGIEYVYSNQRLENRESVAKELDEVKPWAVLNAAGVTGRPNVDWCEDNKVQTIRANVLGGLLLADLTNERGIQLTVFATGCIFSYDEAHPIYSGVGFDEDATPNFFGSFYSETKGYLEAMLKCYPNTLVLRVRMPISDDLSPRSFIYKISKYAKVVNIPNSMTILTNFLPIAIEATQRRVTGVLNFTNPGTISHNQVLDLYRAYIDPKFEYVNFTEEEQNKILKAARSNNELDTEKLEKLFPQVEPVHEGMHGVFQRMRKNMGMKKLNKSIAQIDKEIAARYPAGVNANGAPSKKRKAPASKGSKKKAPTKKAKKASTKKAPAKKASKKKAKK
jgi:dTDP-4-dehydrorhamnose reductase